MRCCALKQMKHTLYTFQGAMHADKARKCWTIPQHNNLIYGSIECLQTNTPHIAFESE